MTENERDRVIEELKRTLWAPLTRYAVSQGAVDAEAAVGDAFLALYQALSQLLTIDDARCWLYSVVRNKACEQHRRRQREDKAFERARRTESDAMTAPSAEQEATKNLSTEDALKWLEHLPGRQADVVRLRFFHDYSLEMIAEKLGIEIATVKTHLFRAYKKLRKSVDGKK